MAAAISGLTDVVQQAAATGKPQTAIEEQQDRFLRLLVAQMQNQDPLSPLDNAQVTMQMAQISTVQGIEKLNATLQAFSQAQSFQAVGMIGRNVLAPGNFLNLQNGMAVAGMDLATAAGNVNVSVLDANGQVVRELALGDHEQGVAMFYWDGKTTAGETASEGAYTFRINATLDNQNVPVTGLAVGAVNSVLMDQSRPASLSVSGMGAVELSQVRQIL